MGLLSRLDKAIFPGDVHEEEQTKAEKQKRDETPEESEVKEEATGGRNKLIESVEQNSQNWMVYIENVYPGEFTEDIATIRELWDKGDEMTEEENTDLETLESKLVVLYQVAKFLDKSLTKSLPDVQDRIQLTPAFLEHIFSERRDDLISVTQQILSSEPTDTIPRVLSKLETYTQFDDIFQSSIEPLQSLLTSTDITEEDKESIYTNQSKLKDLLSEKPVADILAQKEAEANAPKENQEPQPTTQEILTRDPKLVQDLGEATKQLPEQVGGILSGLPAMLVKLENSGGIGAMIAASISGFIESLQAGDGFLSKILASQTGVDPKTMVESFKANYADLKSLSNLDKALGTRKIGWINEVVNPEKGIDPARMANFLKLMYEYDVGHDEPDFWISILDENSPEIPEAFSSEESRLETAKLLATRKLAMKKHTDSPTAAIGLDQLFAHLNTIKPQELKSEIQRQLGDLPKVPDGAQEPEEKTT